MRTPVVFGIISLAVIGLSAAASSASEASDDLEQSKRALDRVGSWLLKRLPSLAQSPNSQGSDESAQDENDSTKEDASKEVKEADDKRRLDRVGSYLLKKRAPPYRHSAPLDRVGSYLLKRNHE
jgi:hypothetical protein